MNTDDVDVTTGATFDKLTALSLKHICIRLSVTTERMIWVLNFNTNKLSFQIPVHLFYTNDLIYVGSSGKINLTFSK